MAKSAHNNSLVENLNNLLERKSKEVAQKIRIQIIENTHKTNWSILKQIHQIILITSAYRQIFTGYLQIISFYHINMFYRNNIRLMYPYKLIGRKLFLQIF